MRCGHWFMLAALAGCQGDRPSESGPAGENRALGGTVAARVDEQPIELSAVASVAAAQNVTAREAVKKIIDDEILALAARRGGRDKQASVSWRIDSTKARFVTDRFLAEAKRAGPPTDEEVRQLTERHWNQVDRPPSVHVMHAIVLLPKDKTLFEKARAIANDLRNAVAPVSNAEFESAAKAVPVVANIQIKVEDLPPLTEEGKITTEPQSDGFDPIFAKAAFSLPAVGATSDIIETKFGFHVIRLLERIPEMRMPIETRRMAFTEETYILRSRAMMQARLNALRAAEPVTVSAAAEQIMRRLKIDDGNKP